MNSLPQDEAGVEGADTFRPSGPATQGVPGLQDQAEGSSLPPPLEPPSTLTPLQAALAAHKSRCIAIAAKLATVTPPPPAGALGEPVPAGEAPKGPSPIVHEGGTIRGEVCGPAQAQLVLTVGGEPLTGPAQKGFDAAWYEPRPLGEPETESPGVRAARELRRAQLAAQPRAPEAPRQDPLPFPRPWLNLDEPLLDLCYGDQPFEVPDYGDLPKAQHGEYFETPGDYLRALGECWKHAARCDARFGAPAGVVEFTVKRAQTVGDCGTRWGNVWQCDTCGHVDKHYAINLTKCESRMCPFCGKQRRGRWLRPVFAFTKKYKVQPRTAESKGHLSRDWYMDTATEVKPPTVSQKGLRASVTGVKKKWPKMAEVAGHLPRDKDWPDKAKWDAAKVKFAAEMEAAKALPPEERKAEQARIRDARAKLYKLHQHKWPGECPDFGMLACIDMDAEAFVHAHVIRYGAWAWADDMREACGGTWTHIQSVRPKWRKGHMETAEEAQAHAVFETVKYPAKMTTKAKGNYYVHPYLAMLFERATCGMRLIEGYGTMRGLVKQMEDAEAEEAAEEAAERPAECERCGGHDLHEVVVASDKPAWQRSRPKKKAQPQAPPGGPGP